MLNCRYCDYLRAQQKITQKSICINYICEYANQELTDNEIDELHEHPCKTIKMQQSNNA